MTEVPYSAGTQRPSMEVPAHACDCHMHIFDRRFAPSRHWRRTPPDAPVVAYRALQERIGTERTVVVNPSTYGTDNACTLDALAAFGNAARGVAVVDVDIADAELRSMATLGVVGIRVNFVSPQSWGTTTHGMLEALARRVAPLGWHVQVFMEGAQIVAAQDVLARLPTTLVIDHLGRVAQPAGVEDPAFDAIRRLLDCGRVWVKLSGAYMDSIEGAPRYSDVSAVAQGFVEAAPERVVWGSDWPHTTATAPVDDAGLIDLLARWAPDARTRERILVENPSELYGFA
jgi:predicted TIM-barrel fold metal-dependent hydrolase